MKKDLMKLQSELSLKMLQTLDVENNYEIYNETLIYRNGKPYYSMYTGKMYLIFNDESRILRRRSKEKYQYLNFFTEISEDMLSMVYGDYIVSIQKYKTFIDISLLKNNDRENIKIMSESEFLYEKYNKYKLDDIHDNDFYVSLFTYIYLFDNDPFIKYSYPH